MMVFGSVGWPAETWRFASVESWGRSCSGMAMPMTLAQAYQDISHVGNVTNVHWCDDGHYCYLDDLTI